ncbi:TPM domain-containing protein [Sphingosinicella humi]|uniref:TPM domain-containing protein n=1 Tax=Allosphingosinicella humi TaxID=2068657 RepID=UPI001FB18A13|nr:TPM domain-containing protein [Sphingosinicella humi]
MWVFLALLLGLLLAGPAGAQEFPKLTGRVIDAANILSPADEAALTQKLAALEQASTRQLVVATIPDLQDYPIEEYGYRLGRSWGIGQAEANNGAILIVAPNERRVRIEVGYGLEPILTDALSSVIIQTQILPRFRENDYPGGIIAGADAIVAQLQAPPEVAEQRVMEAAAQQRESQEGGSIFPLIFWGMVLVFIIIPMFRGGRRGRRYRRGGLPVVIWGPGTGGWGGGSSGGGGFGGFSGGGGSFGGGGASGGW